MPSLTNSGTTLIACIWSDAKLKWLSRMLFGSLWLWGLQQLMNYPSVLTLITWIVLKIPLGAGFTTGMRGGFLSRFSLHMMSTLVKISGRWIKTFRRLHNYQMASAIWNDLIYKMLYIRSLRPTLNTQNACFTHWLSMYVTQKKKLHKSTFDNGVIETLKRHQYPSFANFILLRLRGHSCKIDFHLCC